MEVRIIHATASGTTQDFLSSGLGTCIGAVFYWSRATADGTVAAHAGFGMGCCDGTRQWAIHGADEDASDPSQSATQGSTSHCIVMGDSAGTGTSDVAAFDSFQTDGVRVSWNAGSGPGTAWRIMAVLFSSADSAQCEAGTTEDNADAVDVAHTVTLTDMTVEPEFVMFGSPHLNSFSSTASVDAQVSMGFAKGPNASIVQGSTGFNSDDGRTGANRVAQETRSDQCLKQVSYDAGTAKVAWEATDFGVNGTPRGTFELTKRLAASTVSYGYFAVSSVGANGVHVDSYQFDIPFTAGSDAPADVDYTSASFQPSAMLLMTGDVAQVDNKDANTLAGGIAGIDEDTDAEGFYSWHAEETDPNNSNSYFDSQICRVLHADGATEQWAGTFTSFLSNGFRINVATEAITTGRATVILLIGQPAAGPTRKRAMVLNG